MSCKHCNISDSATTTANCEKSPTGLHEPAEPAAAPQNTFTNLPINLPGTNSVAGMPENINLVPKPAAPADSTPPKRKDMCIYMPHQIPCMKIGDYKLTELSSGKESYACSEHIDNYFDLNNRNDRDVFVITPLRNAPMPESGSKRTDPLRDKNPMATAANEIADFYNQNATMIPQPHHIEAILLRHLAAAPRTQGSKPLKEWRDSVSAAIKTIPEFHSGEWVGDKEGWGFHFEVVRWLQRKREELEKQLAAQPQPAPRPPACLWCEQGNKPVHRLQDGRWIEPCTAIPSQKEEE